MSSNNNFVKISLLVVLLMFESCKSDNVRVPIQPNFVVILVDDLGYNDLDNYQTPNIDKIFNEGISFSNFHAASLCTPTRTAFLTGQYPQRFGKQFEKALVFQNNPMDGLPSTKTIFKALQNNGYKTGLVGKWHLGWLDEFSPLRYGFDTWVGCKSGEIDFHSKVTRNGAYDWYKNDTVLIEEGYVTSLIANHTIDFINENHGSNFALYLPFTSPHIPFQGPNDPADRFVGGTTGIDWPSEGTVTDQDRAYMEMIESLDSAIGEIIASLEDHGLMEKTIVMFISDNGAYNKNFTSNGTLRGYKGELFEGGTRVRCAIQWKGNLTAGVKNDLTFITDIPITIGSLAQVEFRGDGLDLKDLIFGNSELEDRLIYQRRMYLNGSKQVSVTGKKWKFMRDQNGLEYLFDLVNDREEQMNLNATFPDTVAYLNDQILEWETSFQ